MGFKINFQQLFGEAVNALFAKGLTSPSAFNGAVRPILHGHADGDINKAQALAVEGLHTYLHVVRNCSPRFLEHLDSALSYDAVKVPMAGRRVVPVGSAAGLDPHADGLEPFSYLFGFQVPGPVTVEPHTLEPAPFLDDPTHGDLYLPPGLSSRGLDDFLCRLTQFRGRDPQAVIMPAVVGIPSGTDPAEQARRQLQMLAEALAPHVDGLVWTPWRNPGNRLLSPADFAQSARLMASIAPQKLKLVEMAPYEEQDRQAWLELVQSFLAHGGDGLVAVYGLEVPRSRIPSHNKWPYPSAVLFGASMERYRQRAIEDARRRFPSAFIAACGGIHTADAAFPSCQYANVIMENEAFTRYGPGLSRLWLKKLLVRLNYLHRQGMADSNQLHPYQCRQWESPGTDSL